MKSTVDVAKATEAEKEAALAYFERLARDDESAADEGEADRKLAELKAQLAARRRLSYVDGQLLWASKAQLI